MKKMTIIDSKSYVGYFNKLVDQYYNIIVPLVKKPIDADYSATEKIETNPESPKFKVGDRVRITK